MMIKKNIQKIMNKIRKTRPKNTRKKRNIKRKNRHKNIWRKQRKSILDKKQTEWRKKSRDNKWTVIGRRRKAGLTKKNRRKPERLNISQKIDSHAKITQWPKK